MNRYLIPVVAFILITASSEKLMAECISGNCVEGTGTKIYPSGSKYIGEFKEGKEHGKGTLYFFNGSSYEGEFRNGKFHGTGKIRYSNGNEYRGQFLQGRITGKGEFLPPEVKEEVENVYALLPDETDIFVTFPSISEIYRHFSIRRNSIFGNPVKEVSKIEKETGFNPLSIWDLKSIGIDTTKETGFFITGLTMKKKKKPLMNLFFYIPLSDYRLFMERVKKVFEEKSPGVTFTEKEGYIVMEKEGQKEKIYLMNIKDYLLIGGNTDGDALPLIKKILSGEKTLSESGNYRSFTSKFRSSGKIYAYADIQKLIENNRDSVKKFYRSMYKYEDESLNKILDAYQDYKSAALTLDLENRDFNLGIYYEIKPRAKTLALLKGIHFNRSSILGIKKNPILLAILGFNPDKYYEYLISMMPGYVTTSLKKKFTEIKKKHKVDIEKEVIPSLGGNFNFGIYDGKTLNMFNYNVLFTMTVKKRRTLEKAIEEITKTIPKQMKSREKIAGVNTDIYNQGMIKLYTAFKGNQFILSANRSLFEEAVKANKTGGFIKKLKDKDLAISMRKDISMLYINIDEVVLAAKNFGAMSKLKSPEMEKQIRKFIYLLISSNINKNFISGNMRVKTRFDDPFFIGLKKVVDETKRIKAQSRKTRKKSRAIVPYEKTE